MSANLLGEKAPNWRGRESIMTAIRRFLIARAEWQDWRNAVMAQAGNTCTRCGNPAEHAHHKREVAELLALIFIPANGEALCQACHDEHHQQHGDMHEGLD